MKLLIAGGNGQLGRCLQDRLSGAKDVSFDAYASSELDITDMDAVLKKMAESAPDVVVNAAAYTAVDNAEDDADRTFLVNSTGVKNLALACAENSVPLVHISTDYVFDGSATVPYKPASATSPIGVYGQSKLEGERAAQAVLAQLVIIRTAWVYSEYGNNFVKTMLRLAENRDEISVVKDQIGCPTYAGNIAAVILNVCHAIKEGSEHWGVYHYVDSPEMSWHEFAQQIFSQAKDANLLEKEMKVNPIPGSEYPTKAKRPAYSVLDTETFRQDYAVQQYEMTDSLGYVLSRLGRC